LRPHLKPVELVHEAVLFEPGETVDRVYFPHTGIISLVIALASGEVIEAAMIGRDSMLARIVDNGHTIMVTYGPGSSIRVGDAQYQLKQFHFHGPSEETIQGRTYAMEVHLVHADEAGHQAVVAVLLEQGTESPLVRELWRDVPKEKEKEELLEKVRINVADLLPEDRGYYTFEGSLTTPPCSENVTWFVLKQPYHVSAGEIAEFSKRYGQDARPTQPLNGRVVRETN